MKEKVYMHIVAGVVLLALAILLPGAASAQEKGSRVKHPVLPHDIDPKRATEYENAVKPVMAMSEEQMLKLIPVKSAVLFCACPNCPVDTCEMAQFEWSIDRPFELKCRYCGHIFPSEQYPMNWTATGVNALGETVTYKYYFDERSQRDYWLEAHADYLRRGWFVGQCLALARAYHATKKLQYARRAALILNQFASAYPHMAVLRQWPYQRRAVVKPTPPFPWDGGKWGRWMEDEIPAYLPQAYDLIYDSEELDRLSQELGTDVRKRIENEFFRATIEYAKTFGKTPTGNHMNNMAYTYTRQMIYIGRIIGDPSYVHWGYHWANNMLTEGFMVDGMWKESPSYHYQTINGVRIVMQTLKGYSDPEGYKDPMDGLHLENLDMESQSPFVQKALKAPYLVAYPNGRTCPVHDVWATYQTSKPREVTVSTLLPGYGQASLGRGRGEHQVQAQLHFSGAYGHAHADNLQFALFAKGSELLSDIGYTHTKLRYWTITTVSHNTVVVNRQDQKMGNSDGDLLMFVPDLKGLSLVEARGERGYPNLAQVYRRLLLLVPVSDTDTYVVDLFRVAGGNTHDWILHGSADADMTTECSIPLNSHRETMLDGEEKWVEPIGETCKFPPYGLIRDVRHGQTEGNLYVTWRYASDTPPTVALPDTGIRIHVLASPKDSSDTAEVFLGKSPRIRQAGDDSRKVYDYWMPHLVVRRHGAEPLTSTFIAVHEPFEGQPFIRETRILPLATSEGASSRHAQPGASPIGLQVVHGVYTDTIIDTLDSPPYPERKLPGGIVLRGRLAVLRKQAGALVNAWLIDGERITRGRAGIMGAMPRYEGSIESATRKADGAPEDAFITSAPLPEGNALTGQWMIVTHGNGYTHGYEIDRVERRNGKTIVILRDDHGLKIKDKETEECFFPRRKIQGENRFVIHGQNAWSN